MTAAGAISIALLAVFFTCCGWLCVFKTSMVVRWGRESYSKSPRLFQRYPFASIVLKPWYPIYIRCAGIFIWLWATGFIVFVVLHRPR